MSRNDETGQIVLGTLLIIGLNGLVIMVLITFGATVWLATCFGTTGTPSHPKPWIDAVLTGIRYVASSIGAVQLLYAIPFTLILRQRQQWGLMKGIIIGAVLTAFMNVVFFFT